MFEISISLKYLIPKRKHLSVTLIALLSTVVVALVVWLLLVFLSVTEGMEKNWLDKITKLHAPIRITPTNAYFSSYYYKVDSISSASHFTTKTLGEKLQTLRSDPYDEQEDREIPPHWPRKELDNQGNLIDPVKGLALALQQCQKQEPTLLFQDYEMSGATLKLQLLRGELGNDSFGVNFLTQVSYLATPPDQPSTLESLLVSPTLKDINHLFFLANYTMDQTLSDGIPEIKQGKNDLNKRLHQLFSSVQIDSFKLSQIPASILPEKHSFVVYGRFIDNQMFSFFLPTEHTSQSLGEEWQKGSLYKENNELHFSFPRGNFSRTIHTSIQLSSPIIVQAKLQKPSLESARRIQDLLFSVKGVIQGVIWNSTLPWQGASIDSFTLLQKLPLSTEDGGGNGQEFAILLPKTFQDNGILIGDKGFLSYSSSTASGLMEQRISIFVQGFYDPGILSVGNKCLLVPRTVTKTINGANSSLVFDKVALNGFQVWVSPPAKAKALAATIEQALQDKGLQSYWKVTSFHDYDFAKDLLQQFASDRYLFSLIGIIILLVACCNIFSFLLLLVNDKKKEIAILQAMGASKGSIACIFGLCGTIVGCLGCTLGVILAVLTVSNINSLVQLLSALQGHDAFHQTFYGTSLPSTLSHSAFIFICIATPILSLLAGAIPAYKASRLNTSSLLRSDT